MWRVLALLAAVCVAQDACNNLKTCAQCQTNPLCGFCWGSQTCSLGTADGPQRQDASCQRA